MLEISRKTRRPLVCFEDLPEKEKADFDYIKDDDQFTPRLFSYLGSWYDSHEFTTTTSPGYPKNGTEKFDGIQTETFFSGVLIKWLEEDESVHAASYYVKSDI